MRILAISAAATLLALGAAAAQTDPAPNNAAPPRGTGPSNEPINPPGNAASGVNASGTIRTVAMADLAQGANSFTEAQARARIASAGFTNPTGLAQDRGGIWRGHAEREGRTVDVGFDYKGQIAFQ